MARVDLTADVLGDDEPAARPTAPTLVEPVREEATAGPAKKDVFLSVRVPRILRDRLQMQAIREGRSVTPMVIELVENYLEEHERT